MESPRIRSVFDRLPSYHPAPDVRSPAGDSHPLAANESPHPPLAEVVAAAVRAAATVNRYPDFEGTELVARLAHTHGVAEDQVALGAGSVALIQTLFQAVAEPDAEVLYAWRSFELYPVLADLAGIRSVQVPLTSERHDADAIVRRVGEHTRLVLLCNPNNPTGTLLSHNELRALVDRLPETCLVAIDEAYFEYVRHPSAHSATALVTGRPNVVVMRTFSKAYGLAGLRVGYLVGPSALVAQLRKARLPYSLSTVAQAAALTALDYRDTLLGRANEIVAERVRVRRALRTAGWKVPPSEANFLWLRLGSETAAVGQWCADRGVAVRVFPGEGLRVSLGAPTDNDAFLAAMAEWPVRASATGRSSAGRTTPSPA